MSVTYKNAPLLELIAELRWGEGVAAPAAGQAPAIRFSFGQPNQDDLLIQFGAVASAHGYTRFERIVPPGFPFVSGQVMARFRPTNPETQSPLFQLGHGIFTANALPPYKSWQDFSPHVRIGIKSLLTAHERAGVPRPHFKAALIRYIDAFRDNLTRGMTLREFLRDVMKIDLVLPDIIRSKATDERSIETAIKLTAQTAVGQMELAFSQGQVGNDRAILADMSVFMPRDLGSDADVAMQALTEGRQLIHDVFRGLTAPLHRAMEPI